jgi:Uncharacterized protein conserved in bacteria
MKSIDDEDKFLHGLVRGIAAQFGPSCEVVLHDLKNKPYEHSIVAIENGSVTNRRIGDCGTNLGLEVLRGTDTQGDKHNYLTQTNGGRMLRSTSIYIRDPKGNVIGALCINLDVTDLIMAEKAIASVTMMNSLSDRAEGSEEKELFNNDVNDLLDNLIQESIRFVGKPVAMMSKEDKIVGLKFLDKKGAFLIKKAGDKVAQFYGISKFTIYSYLDERE